MNVSKKLLIIYPMVLILIIGGMLASSTEYSYAAESFDVTAGTKWVQGEDIDSGLRIRTKDGTVAYCLNQGKASPSGAYTDKMNLSSKMKAVLYFGYPNNKKFGSTTLTADQARCATQLAVWAHDNSGKGNKIDLDKLHGAYDKKPDGDDVLKAAKWLYNKAGSGYKAPSKPTLNEPKVTKPTNNTPQFYNKTYVRIGPYRFTTTNNSYTSNNKASVNLSGAPAGAKIGNSGGTFISTPSAGTDFYVYLPSDKLTSKGSGSFTFDISYDYEYEKESTFTAYKKDSTQNVAVSTKKEYTSGSKNTNGKDELNWTIGELIKSDSDDKMKPVPNTSFKVYYDSTPSNIDNKKWVFMYDRTTDKNGVLNIPGLGTGTYKIVEVKPNPNYASNSEFTGSDELIFKITNVSNEFAYVMKNKLINVSCEIDKDTIRKTSAAYKSLPDQEGFDNTNVETYRYNVDYRSTSNVWVDELVVDDPLEGVQDEKIRVTELWTPICYGDYDSKMNIWYKTNKTDDDALYSEINAMSSNPVNPNNSGKESVKKNTGYMLWANDISTIERTNLKVSDLELDEDEYITSIRLEHGRVEKGFTTRNKVYESMNDESVVDWTPDSDNQFYTEESASATGLMPLTYLVMCPEPLSPPEQIHNSADVFIARNVHLTDDDKDKVVTEVIDTFKENPINGEVDGDTDVIDENGKVLGQFEDVSSEAGIKDKSQAPKTGDTFKFIVVAILMFGALLTLIILSISGRKSKVKVLPVLIITVLLTGTLAMSDEAFAATRQVEDKFDINGLEYSMVKMTKTFFNKDTDTHKVKYEVNQNIDSKEFDKVGQNKMLPQKLYVNINEYNGKITQNKKNVMPLYLKKQAQIDKTEVLKDLDTEDINALPLSKTYKVRSSESTDATVDKELKRAGVSLKISGYDEYGTPDKWDATVVYRGLETYLEKYQYSVKASYSGKVSKDKEDVRVAASTKEKDYNDLSEEEARERNEEIAKEKYLQAKGYSATEPEPESKPEADGWKTADIIKFLALIAALTLTSFVIFTFLTRRKKKQ